MSGYQSQFNMAAPPNPPSGGSVGRSPLRQAPEASLLIEAAKLFTRAADDARDALNKAGLHCPASISFAAERAREALRLLGVKP